MYIHRLRMRNFRGLKSLDLKLDNDAQVCCLIGPGDSGKSTILAALEWVFWPRYSLSVSDVDFFECDYDEPIEIEATFSGFPIELANEDKYCFYQRRINFDDDHDEPQDDAPTALTLRLTIESDLEPVWCMVKNGKEPRRVSASDRARLPVCVVGGSVDKDTSWGRYSLLQKYSSSKNLLKEPSIEAARKLAGIPLGELDEASAGIPSVVKPYGVPWDAEDSVSNHFVVTGGSLSAQANIFSGKVPLSRFGEGSRRLFSVGLGMGAAKEGALVLIDEIETGLEPHRLVNLIHKLKNPGTGAQPQCVMTTHSPVALRELEAGDLYAVRNAGGNARCSRLQTEENEINNKLQAQLRRSAEAFLTPRVIVCEGQTEVGLIRALDEHTSRERGGLGIASVGAFPFTAEGGNNMIDYADHLHRFGYQVCVLMDSDVDGKEGAKLETGKKRLEGAGVPVFAWDVGLSLEEQVFKDISATGVKRLIELAGDRHDRNSIKSRLANKELDLDALLNSDAFDEATREKIGLIAAGKVEGNKNKRYGWFKSVGGGEEMGKIVLMDENFGNDKCNSMSERLLELRQWAFGQGGAVE